MLNKQFQGVIDRPLMRLLEIIKMQKISSKLMWEEKIGEDSIVALVKSK